jgi:hypothetical protein
VKRRDIAVGLLVPLLLFALVLVAVYLFMPVRPIKPLIPNVVYLIPD